MKYKKNNETIKNINKYNTKRRKIKKTFKKVINLSNLDNKYNNINNKKYKVLNIKKQNLKLSKKKMLNTKVNNYNTNTIISNLNFLSILSKEVIYVVNNIKLNQKQSLLRNKTLLKIKDILNKHNFSVELYGSFSTNLSLSTSDLDITVFTKEFCIKDNEGNINYSNDILNKSTKEAIQQKTLSIIINILYNYNIIKHNSLQVIRNCKVPLIKFTDKNNNIAVDITINQNNGIYALNLINSIINNKLCQSKKENILVTYFHNIIHPTIMFLKLLLRQYSLNDASKGSLSSFTIFHLVYIYYNIFLIEILNLIINFKNISIINILNALNPNIQGIFILKFLKFYSNEFDNSIYILSTEELVNNKLNNKILTNISNLINSNNTNNNINTSNSINNSDIIEYLMFRNNNIILNYLEDFNIIKKKNLITEQISEENISIQSIIDSKQDVGTACRNYCEIKRLFAACLYQIKTNYKHLNKNTENCKNLTNNKILHLLKNVLSIDCNFNF